jgi:hypothetical protein
MIGGPPGSFKSALALNLLVRWARQGVYGLYLSADADEFTVSKRAAAIIMQRTIETIEADRTAHPHIYERVLMQLDNTTRFFYRVSDIDEIDRYMRSFEAVFGVFPRVLFVDNLLNVSDSADDWTACRELIRNLDILAREAECHICVLHHTSEFNYQPGLPPPRSALLGKISQFPRLILTVGTNESTLNVACVKNTNGPQDPSGRSFFPMVVDAERMTITDSGFFTQEVFAAS